MKGSSTSLIIWVQLLVFIVSVVDVHVDSSRFSCCCRKPNERLGQSVQDSGLECGLQVPHHNSQLVRASTGQACLAAALLWMPESQEVCKHMQ